MTYSDVREAVGEHLRNTRMDRKLFQHEVAEQLGVTPDTVRNWEFDQTEATIRHSPALIEFLGLVLLPVNHTLG